MRNQRLVLIVALVVLLIGGGLAGYLVLTSEGGSGRADQPPAVSTSGADQQAGPDKPADTDPAKGAGAATGTEQASSKPVGVAADSTETAKTTAGETTSQPKGTTSEKVEIKPAETAPEDWTESWPSKTSEFVITGKITYKTDGRPAAGAAITAERAENLFFGGEDDAPPAVSPPAQKIEGSTVSDGAGEFMLRLSITRKVPPGPEDTSDEAKGARALHDATVYVQVVGKLAGYAPARSPQVELHEGKEAKVSLTLSIPAALKGRVIDAVTRAGIEGARVELYSGDFGSGGWSAPRNATTDKEGFFSVTDLPAGRYMCGASATGYASIAAWDSGKSADLTRGGEQDIGEIALLKAGTIVGVVIDSATAEPVKGASVSATAGEQYMNFLHQQAVTGEDGKFELKSVAAGQYTLTVKADGYAPAEVERLLVESGATLDAGTIKLGRGFVLSGTVKDAKGSAVAGASVKVKDGAPGALGFGINTPSMGSAITDQDGKFSISGMAEGKAKVEATADGYARAEITVELKPGMGEVALTLGKGASVKGRVLAASGAPAASVAVGIVSHESGYYRLYKLQPSQFLGIQQFGDGAVETRTGEDGRFVLPNVAEGVFLLLAIPDGGKGVARDDLKISEGADIDLGDLQLSGPGAVVVKVTEEGQPVVGLKVELRSSGVVFSAGGTQHPSAETDGTGVANFADIAAGEYRVHTARDKDNWDSDVYAKRRIQVTTGRTTEFKLELKPADAARVHGHLTLDGKARFTTAYLVGYGVRAGLFKEAKPDETGFYEFDTVAMGTYVVHARVGDKGITCPVNINVDKAGDMEITRDFVTRTISGTVSTPLNTPTERATVRMTLHRVGDATPEQFGQWMRGEMRCDADGKFRFEHVVPGAYRVTASLEGVGSVGRDVNMTGSDVGGVDITVAANGGTLKVIVKKLHGTLPPESFGFVQVKDAGGHVLDFDNQNIGFFVPGDNAAVELPTIPAGTYTVMVSASSCLGLEKTGVVITKDKRTDLEVEITVGAELQLTVTNAEITQAMLDAAKVTYLDAQGAEVPKTSSIFDSWSRPPVTDKPTLRARYIGPRVAQVRIKLAGYAELAIPVEFEAGKKIEKTETLVAE